MTTEHELEVCRTDDTLSVAAPKTACVSGASPDQTPPDVAEVTAPRAVGTPIGTPVDPPKGAPEQHCTQATPPDGSTGINAISADAMLTPAPVPLVVDRWDRLFALVFSVVGFAFIYVFTAPYLEIFGFSTVEWLLLFFTGLYAAAVLGYARIRGVTPPKESWFWLAAMLCFIVPLPFYCSLGLFQPLGLICMAAYWTLSVAGGLIGANSGAYGFFPLDALNALVVVPFRNFFCHIRVLVHATRRDRPEKANRRTLGILLGVVLAIPLLCIVLPLLSSADAAFSGIFDTLFGWLARSLRAVFGSSFQEFVFRFLLSMPVTAYLFGLVYGGLRRRHTGHFTADGVRRRLNAAHVLPNSSAYTVLAVLCVIYVLFICMQTRYLFSGFTGVLPDGFTFSEYARNGFFELCRIAALNVCVLAATNATAKTRRMENARLRGCNMVLSVLSILLLATAASKMVLYIGAYGLTPLRVLSSVVLIWLLVVFVALLVWQKRAYDITRVCLVTGVVLACVLCVVNVEGGCDWYNRMYGFV